MPQKKYLVTLTPEEREQLAGLLSAGKRSALTLARARILLKADQAAGGPAWPDERIAEALDCGVRTVERVRQRFVERGLQAALGRKKQDRPSRERKLDGRAEARLIALACSQPPDGRGAGRAGRAAGQSGARAAKNGRGAITGRVGAGPGAGAVRPGVGGLGAARAGPGDPAPGRARRVRWGLGEGGHHLPPDGPPGAGRRAGPPQAGAARMTEPLTIECAVHFRQRGRGSRRELRNGPEPPRPVLEPGRVPRVARLMALAIRLDGLLRSGAVASSAELARLGHVSRARPPGASAGSFRVNRGGSFRNAPRDCRAARRGRDEPAGRSLNVGFRVVRVR